MSKKRKSFIQWFLALFAALFLGIVASINMVTHVFAGSTIGGSGLTDTGIGLTVDGTDNFYTCEANGTTIKVTATGEGGTCSSSHTTTLTITNKKGGTGTLSFSYTLTLSSGTVKIGGSSVTTNSTYTNSNFANNGTLKIEVASAKAASTTTINITNITLSVDISATTTFNPDPSNGTYGTYTATCTDGGFSETITSTGKSHTTSSINTYSIVASPKSGYTFDSWHITTGSNSSLNTNASVSGLSFTAATTIYPVFKPATAATFLVTKSGTATGTRYFDLTEAINASTSTNNVISVVGNGTVNAGSYTIPSGRTLLVPYDNANTVYTTAPDVIYGSHTTPSAFKTLTLAQGANITVANGGQISVASKLSATGTGSGSWNGTPTGAGGRIFMNYGSTITIQSGGGLYTYGYIAGYGNVNALSGSTIYEAFQVRCWRGGTCTTSSTWESKKVFQMSQYYVQNIEASLTINSGATMYVYIVANANSSAYTTKAAFIGTSGMFKITSGSVTKRFEKFTYNESTNTVTPIHDDRLYIEINGNVTISSFSISISVATINTSDFNMPINSNLDITVASGTVTVAQDLAFLPGSALTINQGASFNINSGKNVFVYDQSEWGAYAADSQQLVVVGYSVANGANAKRTTANLVDCSIDVNGTLNATGSLYTTASGANIHSTGQTGKIVFNYNTSSSTTTTYQCTQSGTSATAVAITCYNAWLKNGENAVGKSYDVVELDTNGNEIAGTETTITPSAYTQTGGKSSGTTFYYNNADREHENDYTYGWWYHINYGSTAPELPSEYKINFSFNGSIAFYDTYTENSGLSYNFPLANDSRIPASTYAVKRWNSLDGLYSFTPGESVASSSEFITNLVGDITFVPFYGGWIYESSESGYSYVKYSDGSNPTGLYTIEYVESSTGYDELFAGTVQVHVGDICYFNASGIMKPLNGVYNCGTSDLYFLSSGVVRTTPGLVAHEENIYCVSNSNTLYRNNVYYINESIINGITTINPGYYQFANDGHMIVPGQITQIDSNYAKDSSGNIVYGYGLFLLNNHLYYCKQDGTIVTNCTFYVEITNNYFVNFNSNVITIQSGLFYFDSNGYMYYGNELLDGTGVEFEAIVSGTGHIVGRNNG